MVAYVVNGWPEDTWSGTFKEVSGLFKALSTRKGIHSETVQV